MLRILLNGLRAMLGLDRPKASEPMEMDLGWKPEPGIGWRQVPTEAVAKAKIPKKAKTPRAKRHG